MTNRALNAGDTAILKPAWHQTSASPATRLATGDQRRRALWTCIGIVVATLLLLPLAAFIGPPVPAFLPSYQTATVVAYVIITYLIFAHYRATRTLDLLYIGVAAVSIAPGFSSCNSWLCPICSCRKGRFWAARRLPSGCGFSGMREWRWGFCFMLRASAGVLLWRLAIPSAWSKC